MRLTVSIVVSALLSAMGQTAKADAGAASASQTAPGHAPSAGPTVAPAAAIDPWTGAPVPYSPPQGYGPPPTYPSPPQAYPMPYSYFSPRQPPPGFHTHDGFFLRFMMGLGQTRVASASSGYDLQAKGLSFGDMFSLGWSVRENLVISWDTSVFFGSPTVTGSSRTPGATDAFFGFIQLGPGLTYYFMPHNVFASAGFGLGNIFISEQREGQADVDHDMNMGWGATLSGGKEWWTSDNWGLGAAGRFVYVQSRETETNCRYRAYSFSVAFTATYN